MTNKPLTLAAAARQIIEFRNSNSPWGIVQLQELHSLIQQLERAYNGHTTDGDTLTEYIFNHRTWSHETFGEGKRSKGLVEHIRKKLLEIEAKPDDIMEWVDVIILAIDGAWRQGYSPAQIATALLEKQRINMEREWPESTDPDKPTEHIRKPAQEEPVYSTEHVHKLEERLDRCETALHSIKNWSDAYPLDIFPEPDFKKVREALEAAGLTLDSVSASNMRHVVEGVGKIARDALKEDSENGAV